MGRRLLSVLEHKVVRDVLLYVLILAILYLGTQAALRIIFRTDSPLRAVISNSMKHDGEGWKDYYLNLGLDPSKFPFQGGFERGDLLVVEGISSPMDVALGEVIVYKVEGQRVPIVHRVVEVIVQGSGVSYRTKGDANLSPDGELVEFEMVLGRVKFAIPKLGYLFLWREGA